MNHSQRSLLRPVLWLILTLAALTLLTSFTSLAAERPNFLWILSEDNATDFLKLFNSSGAEAPNIEKLAAHGLAFDHAFSCAPVCSVARTTLMSGVHAPRLGTQFHRKIQPATLPAGWKLFPAYLREAGYYTSNNSKTDYNTSNNEGVWDESSNKANWRKRPNPDTSFLHMQTYTASHESSLHFSRQKMESEPTTTDPKSVRLPNYHPDTPLFRYTYARYHDRMRDIDNLVGKLVGDLEKDGLLEDTFIFYFGDNGGVLPGSKGYLSEMGLHVPLVVRVPDKWRHLVDAPNGSRIDGFVSFVDFGPTVLRLAGIKSPPHLDGQAFLGEGVSRAEVNARQETLGYADRFDEKYEMVRSLRVGQFKYVRNYQGYYPDALQNNYRYLMLAYEEWRDLFHAGKLNPAQRRFFEPKPAEALYDLAADPDEVRNLAHDPAHRATLETLRARLKKRLTSMPDLSFYPESELVAKAMTNPIAFGQEHQPEISRLLDLADLAVRPFPDVESALQKALRSDNRWERYWALTDASLFGQEAQSLIELARPLLQDEEPTVRLRAAEFLGALNAVDPRPTLLDVLRTSNSPVVALLALNSVVYLRDGRRHWEFHLQADDVRARNSEVARRLEYLAP